MMRTLQQQSFIFPLLDVPRTSRGTSRERMVTSCLLFLSAALLLTGCGGEDNKMQKTHEFVASVEQTKGNKIDPLPHFTIPQLPPHSTIPQRNPFAPGVENQQVKPDTNHAKGPLESFPLADLHFVGTLSGSDQLWGLISVPSGAVYNISKGQYIGQNYGKVVQITPQKIIIEETVSDGLGGWTTRTQELPITTQQQDSLP